VFRVACLDSGREVAATDHESYRPSTRRFGTTDDLWKLRSPIEAPGDDRRGVSSVPASLVKHWHKQNSEKINDRLWHLGSVTIDKFHYYYQVDLDADHKVLRGKLKADR
jgi:hypothetical protein